MKIGIMGGTFNPIHNGHLTLASAALTQYALDEVWFMPSGLPAHKSNTELLPANIRLSMAELAIAGQKGFTASSFEIDRKGFTYTADTMTALAEEYPEDTFFFIIGGDSLMKFHHWVKPEVISKYAVLLAAGRDGYSKEQLEEQEEQLRRKFGTKVLFLDMPEVKISSHEIRDFCKRGQYQEIRPYVPEPVWDFMIENRLYQ
ncbi:MAG: nicotinate-nucleotide adenylyltransferase [Lachnospiraceae bacterium]|nr:nicotinate-nucleotide adenylyltransferase [Lachnospiraceae bacterium]